MPNKASRPAIVEAALEKKKKRSDKLHFTRKLRLVFSRFFYICRNLGYVKEKPTKKICFSRELKRLVLRIYLAKFC